MSVFMLNLRPKKKQVLDCWDLSNIKKLFDKKFTQLEAKINGTISKKVKEIKTSTAILFSGDVDE